MTEVSRAPRWVEFGARWPGDVRARPLPKAKHRVGQARERQRVYMQLYNAEHRGRLVEQKRALRQVESDRVAEQRKLVASIYLDLLTVAGLRVVVSRPVQAIYRQLLELAGLSRSRRKPVPQSLVFGDTPAPDVQHVFSAWRSVSDGVSGS